MGMSTGRLAIVKVILFSLFLFLAFRGGAQQKKTGPESLLTFPVQKMRLDSLSRSIDQQSGLVLSFNASLINPGQLIAIPRLKIRLAVLLKYLQETYGLTGHFIGNHIILHQTKPIQPDIVPTRISKPTRVLKKSELTGLHRRRSPEKDSRNGRHYNTKATSGSAGSKVDSIQILSELPSIGRAEFSKRLMQSIASAPATKFRVRPDHLNKFDSLLAKTEQSKSREQAIWLNNSPFVSAGIVGDEIFYVRPAVRAGVPWLFAELSWHWNSSISGFTYGIGSSIQLSDIWNLGVTVATGALSDHASWLSPDSIIEKVGIKGRLTRADIIAEMSVTRHIRVQFGPTVNFLNTSYRIINNSQQGATVLPSRPEMERTYHLVKPPYAIRDSYSKNNASNKKLWIGLQVGLFYELN